jgi:uncharacterized protein YjaG (DUF416 family)
MDIFREEIKAKLSRLTYEAKALFAVITSEMLHPNYAAFKERNNWGDDNVLQDAISQIYYYIINSSLVSIAELEDIETRIEFITPDTEDFTDVVTSFALDACTALMATIRFIVDKDVNRVLEVSDYAIDTVYAFIQLKENYDAFDPSSDIQTEHDSFMLQEKQRQISLISSLSESVKITDHVINRLKGNSPIIDLSLLTQ